MLEPLIREEAKKRQATSTGGVNPQLVQNSAHGDNSKTRNELAKIAGVSRKEPNGNYRRFKPYLIYCKRFIL